jgi:glycosyltransferase involved in cell wall biosynthesis
MRILLASAHPYLPEIRGGAQMSTHELTRGLSAAGHDVGVFAGFMGNGVQSLWGRFRLKIARSSIYPSTYCDYPVLRAWHPWKVAKEARDRFRPDVVVAQSGLPVKVTRAFKQIGVPTVLYFRNVEDDDLGGTVLGSADAYIANSRFTSDYFESVSGVKSTVILPTFDAQRYRTDTSRRFVTFINPHPHKGRDIAFALMRRCPDVEFLIVRAWSLDPDDEAQLEALDRECANVTVREPTSDMRTIYAQTRIVLAPSQWQEAYGRIATEGHFSGIPTLASNIGGLPEAVGPGGILVAPDAPVEAWEAALLDMLNDPAHYDALSQAALQYSERPELDRSAQLRALVSVCTAATGQCREPAQAHSAEPAI